MKVEIHCPKFHVPTKSDKQQGERCGESDERVYQEFRMRKVEGNDQIKFPAPLRLRRDELNTIFEYRVGEAKPEIGEDSIK